MTHTKEHRENLIYALDEAIEQGLITETSEVTAYRGYLAEISDDMEVRQVTWPKKPYAFEPARASTEVDDGEAFHCKNRDYIAHPFKSLPTDPKTPLDGERE